MLYKLRAFISICICVMGITMLCLAVSKLERSNEGSDMLASEKKMSQIPEKIMSVQDIVDVFAMDAELIAARTQQAIEQATKRLQQILSIAPEERTFANTMRALDTMAARLQNLGTALHTLTMVSPDESVRTAAQQAVLSLEAWSIEHLSQNKALYKACTDYHAHAFVREALSDEQKYYVTESIRDMKRAGLELPDATQEQLKKIKKELSDLELAFQTAINTDQRSIKVTKDALAGLSQEYIATLSRDGDLYVLGTDTPTVTQVGEHCTVGETRKALSLAYANRAYPQNSDVLKKIIALRDELAKLLGYQSYADLEIEDSMAKSVDRVETFLSNLAQRVEQKVAQEMAELQNELPAGVSLTPEGKFYPWDLGYVKACYKKQHLQIDEREIAKYFPVDTTLPALLKIYEEFFAVTFKQVPVSGLWHSDVQLVAMYKKDTLVGYLLLDLFPRPNKYTHACEIDIYKAQQDSPALAVVIANFPKATQTTPGLLKHNDVVTFFHEFGHAIHDLLSKTEMVGFAGTSVKRDFVEMPSQMLEEWIWDTQMLKRVSAHYETGEPLSDEQIVRLRALKDFCTGDFVQRQLCYAQLSLQCFKEGAQKDPYEIKKTINMSMRPHIEFIPEDHTEASFGHLMGYGARYYGYMWSKVFALDMFEHIKEQGILNPVVGCKYADEILGKGGSVDPEVMLTNFLGRPPCSDAFFKDLGI